MPMILSRLVAQLLKIEEDHADFRFSGTIGLASAVIDKLAKDRGEEVCDRCLCTVTEPVVYNALPWDLGRPVFCVDCDRYFKDRMKEAQEPCTS